MIVLTVADLLNSINQFLTVFTPCLIACATILVGLYCYQWSDDAWARRAYDAAATVDGEDNPGRYYQWARETFDRKGRKAAKDKILKLEDKTRKINEAIIGQSPSD